MSVERSSAPASPKTVTSADSAGTKGKVRVGDEADAGAGIGFFAILTALEPQVEDSVEEPQVTSQPVVLPDVALPPSLPGELAMLLGQSGQAGEVRGDQWAAGGLGGVRSSRTAVSADMADIANQKPLLLGTAKAKGVGQHVNALLDQRAQGMPGMMSKAQGDDLKSGAAASLAESRALDQLSFTDAMTREPAISSAVLVSGLGDGFLRLADRPGSKTQFQPGGFGLEGSWGQSAFQADNKADAPSVVVDPSAPSFEATVADTVSYWVAQGVQKAELKLDGLDGESIAVSISLKGDEAHIGFRTDKPETRQMLEGAVAHLKEMLTNEGLVLSGVSVGTSGQDGAGAQEQGSQPGARQASLVSTEPAPAKPIQRVNQSVGRALDLYV